MSNQQSFDKQCPGCHGAGEYIEPVLDYGEGPSYPCGYCEGNGRIYNKTQFYSVLGYISADKAKAKKFLNNYYRRQSIGKTLMGVFRKITEVERESNKSQARMFVSNAKKRNN